ncbi:hypothetical protein ApDm4_0331 [Acetobacter pomorum]|nr:hypothetical protein ApDm4_0331 [Acetobacter pomorum]
MYGFVALFQNRITLLLTGRGLMLCGYNYGKQSMSFMKEASLT